MSFIGLLAGVATAIVVTTTLVYMIGFEDPQSESDPKPKAQTSEPQPAAQPVAKALTLLSPANGARIALSSVNDESFAQKLLGDGIAIVPSEGLITAPCDAEVSSVIESQHAVGLTCSNGAELLIHVGLDTVNLKGQYFKTLVSVGQKVRAGDALIEFDKQPIEQAGYDLTTPFIILNSDEFSLQFLADDGQITTGQPMIQMS
ncbi:PTS glucose transporter subunit IIA [Vibrio sp. CDRSL-10 TSBA]